MSQEHIKIKLDELIKKLIKRGEDERELRYWQGIFDVLEEDEQKELILILEKEMEELEKPKNLK